MMQELSVLKRREGVKKCLHLRGVIYEIAPLKIILERMGETDCLLVLSDAILGF